MCWKCQCEESPQFPADNETQRGLGRSPKRRLPLAVITSPLHTTRTICPPGETARSTMSRIRKCHTPAEKRGGKKEKKRKKKQSGPGAPHRSPPPRTGPGRQCASIHPCTPAALTSLPSLLDRRILAGSKMDPVGHPIGTVWEGGLLLIRSGRAWGTMSRSLGLVCRAVIAARKSFDVFVGSFFLPFFFVFLILGLGGTVFPFSSFLSCCLDRYLGEGLLV